MIAAVPLVVPRPEASRHLLPYTCSCLPDVYVHRWLVPPLQSHKAVCVPLVVEALGTSRHRPDWVPTTVTFCRGVLVGGALVGGPPVGGPLVGGPLDGGVVGPDWNWVKKAHTAGL